MEPDSRPQGFWAEIKSLCQERGACKGLGSTTAIVQLDGPGDSAAGRVTRRRHKKKKRHEGHWNSDLSIDGYSQAHAHPRRLPQSDLHTTAPSSSPNPNMGPTRLLPCDSHTTAPIGSSPRLAQGTHQYNAHARKERKKERKESKKQKQTEERLQAEDQQRRDADLPSREEGDGMLHQQGPVDTALESHDAHDPVRSPNDDLNPEHICPVCGKIYEYEISLNRHFERRHAADLDMDGTTFIETEALCTTANLVDQKIEGRKRKREDDHTAVRHAPPSEPSPKPASPTSPSSSRRNDAERSADRYSWLPARAAQELVSAFGVAVRTDPKLTKTFDDMMRSIKEAHEACEEGSKSESAPDMTLAHAKSAKSSSHTASVAAMSERRRGKQRANESPTVDSLEDLEENENEPSSHLSNAAELRANYSCGQQQGAELPRSSQLTSEGQDSEIEGSSIFEDSEVDNAAESSPIPTLNTRPSMQPCSARKYFGLLKKSKRRLMADGKVFLPISDFRRHVSKAKKAGHRVKPQPEGEVPETEDDRDRAGADYNEKATSSLRAAHPNTSWPALPYISTAVQHHDSSKTQFRKFYTKLMRHIESRTSRFGSSANRRSNGSSDSPVSDDGVATLRHQK